MALKTIAANIFKTPGIAAALITNVKKQKAFIRKYIQPDLDEAEHNNDGTLDASDLKKITSYYGLAIPAIIGEFIASLRGYGLIEEERKALTYLGATTGLFDDFFDKFNLSDERIRALLDPDLKITGNNSAENLFLHFYKKALGHVPDRNLLFHYIIKVYEAQIESRKQAMDGLSEEEIFHITIEKGGMSVLLYRAAMSNPISESEIEGIYEIGGLMQFGNDLFDIYKDRNDQIRTLPTTSKNIDHLRKLFDGQLEKSYLALGMTPYKAENKKKFLRLLSLCLCSRCFVALDQLKTKQEKTGNIFVPEKYTRQDLICDMDKKINQWRSLKYHLRQDIKIPVASKL